MRNDKRRARVRHLSRLLGAGLVALAGPAHAAAPSFDCAKVAPGSVEALVCQDAALAAADRKLAQVFVQAQASAGNVHPPMLRAEQRGWIKGRDECWKSEARRACVAAAYRLRTAELQARYRLLPPVGTATYVCAGAPEITASYFATDPPSALARRGDQVSFMVQQPAASGARYQGPNELLWEHQGEATVRWGAGSPELRCEVRHPDVDQLRVGQPTE